MVVDDNPDDKVEDCDDGLANYQGTTVVVRISHLGCDGEERRRTGVRKDDGGEGGDGINEGRVVGKLVVRDPDTGLGRRRWATLNPNGDGDDQNCDCER